MWKRSDPSSVCDENYTESVGSFFERHFGQEVVDYLIDPFVGGTSAADPESLSICHTFPELWDLEKRFGSIITGALKSKLFSKPDKTSQRKVKIASRKDKHKRGSFSFLGGMQTLTDALCKELGQDDLKLNSKVLTLAYNHDGSSSSQNWSISCASNQNIEGVDAVIMTAPLSNVKEMKITKRATPFPLNFLPEVTYVPLSVIITTFRKENVKRPLEGFGVLVPSKEQQNGLKTLGTLFSSMMFPDRAPSDLHLYTTFIGGTRNTDLAKASTDELKSIVTSDLRNLLGAEGEPTFVNHFYWSKGFPLYGRNYALVLQAIDKMEKDLPGFFYAGNHKGGLSVGKAIASGCKAADLVITYLNSSSENNIVPDK
ncbi:protoporphyrinogen oxidase, chloroplastic/mitochondrial isoform X4 [Arachis ipaensis]|nr:protoporphyrinogen oxidase, chloroplastic/mitochondrial isoform X4 [Arachis ipaensis]